jgi:hypothetical protein
VITATSAAALAIQVVSDTAQIYWLVTTFYSIAFGLSLEGLILITYMTISAGGASDEAICRIVQGKLLDDKQPGSKFQGVKPVAFTMALPAILATYSSMSLLAGLVVMVIAGPGQGVQARSADYIIATMIPVGGGFICLCIAILFCEIGTWIELRGRAPHRKAYKENMNQPALGQQTGVMAGLGRVRVCPDLTYVTNGVPQVYHHFTIDSNNQAWGLTVRVELIKIQGHGRPPGLSV